MKKENILKWIVVGLAIAINVFIIVNAFINGEVSAKESNDVAHTAADVINTVKPETVTPQNFDKFAFNFRKAVGHFGLFALSGVLSTWAHYLLSKDQKYGYFPFIIAMSLGFGFIMAIGTELTQKFVPGRTGAWMDVLIDFSGYFLGFLLLFLILLIRKSKIFYKKNYMKKLTTK